MATTGSNLAACLAGINPAPMPVMMQIRIANPILVVEIKTGKSKTPDKIFVSRKTRINPMRPPTIHRNADSSKNSDRITVRLAPIAFFNPIWLVRSLTDTNIILATPNIPTINDNAAITQPPMFRLTNALLMAALKSLISFNVKSSSCTGVNLCTARTTPVHSSLSAVPEIISFPLIIIKGSDFFSSIIFRANL